MINLLKTFLPAAAACALVLGFSTLTARAEDAKDKTTGKGSITGTVTDKDGKALEGVTVNLYKPRQGGGRGPGAGGPPPAAPKTSQHPDAIGLQQRQPPPPIATTTTDKDGKYELKDVEAGDYMVAVRDTDKKQFGRARVTVKDGETATADIKCSDTPPQRPPGGGRGPGAPGGEAPAKPGESK